MEATCGCCKRKIERVQHWDFVECRDVDDDTVEHVYQDQRTATRLLMQHARPWDDDCFV